MKEARDEILARVRLAAGRTSADRNAEFVRIPAGMFRQELLTRRLAWQSSESACMITTPTPTSAPPRPSRLPLPMPLATRKIQDPHAR